MTADLDEDEAEGVEPKRWSWLFLAGCTVNTVGNLSRIVVSLCDEVCERIARHELWREDRRDFADSIRRDLETISEPVKVE